MNQEELKLLLPVLQSVRDTLADQSCNDWQLPNTQLAKFLWWRIQRWAHPDEEPEIYEHGDTIFCVDFVLLDYLIHCIENGKIAERVAVPTQWLPSASDQE